MDAEKLKFLNDEQKDRYHTLERLFDSPGWRIVEEWAQLQRDNATARLIDAQSWEQNRRWNGAREAFGAMVNLQNATEVEFEALSAAAEAAQVAEEEAEYE